MNGAGKTKKSHTIVRGIGSGLLLALIVLLAAIYVLYSYGLLDVPDTWPLRIRAGLTVLAVCLSVGALYGLYRAMQTKIQFDRLQDTLLLWEKGNPTRPVWPIGGEMEGLAEQLERVGKKWEEQVNSLQRLSTHNAQLAEQARVSAIVEERQRLARELHDAVSQQLFAISMTATAVGRTFEKDLARARRQVELIEEMASVAQSEMRALLLHLRPVYLEGKPLYQGLSELVREIQAKAQLEITLDMDAGLELVKGIENHLFRIVQEALSNTLRHAKADKMEIMIVRRSDALRMSLKDNGIGFELDEKKQSSYGLSLMQERVSEIGGSIRYITAPGKGTRIELTVPLVSGEQRGSEE
ncbi:sensor histidine kinase [Saccharibacillus alkalitolerans]|uniref:Sensor histidine kinase n=1 Tax=Saccharibacillus alkalitolerans TaxID=2705290 RepID=A0ABX0FA78_9BACL|nr:sensor histidine kinase [Saccharibacillus alkalitolerans]NGZ76860.1 sensor histidine kinase [Saccharibacillus alkalitolerans]